MAEGELKKHVGAIHIKGRLSLLERKVTNVLLLNAYEDLPNPDVFEHQVRIATLAEASGFDSNDHQMLKQALETLVSTRITWNVLDEAGQEEWGVSSFLAQAVIKNGMCRYAYAPELRRKLFRPEVYARINLAVQERFGSGYALALYENCVRFRRVGSTGFMPVQQWRDLLGVEDGQHEEFKYLNRDVLKPAIQEVNAFSDIRLKMERKRSGRAVAELKFVVEEPQQLRLDLDAPPSSRDKEEVLGKSLPDPVALAPSPDELIGPLRARLLAFGLSEAQALEVATTHDQGRVEGNLAYVEAELEAGRSIRNVAAFTLRAIEVDYRPQQVSVVQEVARRKQIAASAEASKRAATEARQRQQAEQARAQEAKERQRQQDQAAALLAAWEALPDQQRTTLESRALRRLREEVPYAYKQHRSAQGKSEEDWPIALRSALRAIRYEEMERAAGKTA